MIRLKINQGMIFLVILCSLVTCTPYTWSAVLFEDNFDNHADWSPSQPSYPNSIACIQGVCSPALPTGSPSYYAYRVAGVGSCAEVGKNTLNINNTQPRGGSGKSLLYWSEPCPFSGSWGSDGSLVVYLPSGSNELYIRYFLKFQSNWVWQGHNGSGQNDAAMQKFCPHIGHWDGQGGVSGLFSWNNVPHHIMPTTTNLLSRYGPMSTYPPSDTFTINPDGTDAEYVNGISYITQWDQQSEFSKCTGSGASAWTNSGCPGDGNWHSYEYHLKANTVAGIANGVYEMWFDGIKINAATRTNLIYHTANGNVSKTFNIIMIGGNNYNYYTSVNGEQWYALDDFVVATSYIGTNYVIGGGSPPPQDTMPPAAPSNLQ